MVFRSVTYELAPATVQEFSVADDALPTFFLRSCVEAAGESACEWAPKIAQAGFYYSLAEQKTAGGLADSSLTELTLEPVLAEASEAASAPVAESTPPQALCSLLVPALNVRSGPGLEYQIVAKVRGTADEPATVIVTGRNESSEWLAVTDRLADGGWITGSASYVACQGDLAALPVAEISDGRLAPTPEPVAQPEAEPADPAPVEEEAASETPSLAASRPTTPTDVLEAPAGQALLQVRNDFDHVIRFTIDQRFRPAQGPSEYDLEPGQAIQVAVWPGQVAFSVSTPWRGLSGNADMVLESGQTRDLKLTFVPDPEESGKWNLLVWE